METETVDAESFEKQSALPKFLKNKFVLGLLTGLTIGFLIDNLFVVVVLFLALSVAWYGVNRKKA